ncbi:hypothetical protein DERP_001061 [Dermatophagoides pteronyssinus]|nr:hypothetical protein DERP_001061 [Dermatophagoides pteronyssinus]
MIIAIRNSLFHLKSSVLLSTFNRVQIHTSIRFDRNFFNYEQFTKESNVGRKTPPKMKGKFSEIYKRRPLFWMIRGTDALVEHNQICLAMAGFSFVVFAIIIGWAYWRHLNNKSIPGQKFNTMMNRNDSPERQAMFELRKRFTELGLIGNFAKDNFNDFGELKRIEPPITENFDDIRHPINAIRREDSGRDVTKIVESKSKSLKEVDKALRQ